MLSSPPNGLGSEYFVNFYDLDHVNLDKPWWDQNYRTAQSIGGKLTTAVNSIMITHMDSVLAMLYNKQLAEDYKLPDLYQIVRDGDWTLDKWAQVSKNVTVDLNGDGVYDDNDQYAFLGLDGIGRLASGVQLKTIVKDGNDIPSLNFDETLIGALTSIREFAMTYDNEIYNPRTDSNTGGDGDKAVFRLFQNDQALFYVHGLGAVQMFREMESDFGVIPTPKLDENQEDYFIAPDQTKCMGVPTTNPDLDRTAVIIEALAYEGYTYLCPLYYEAMLQSKYLRDEESVEMMDEYIYPNIGFTTHTGASTLNSTINTIRNGKGEVVSTLESNKSAIEAEITKYTGLFMDSEGES